MTFDNIVSSECKYMTNINGKIAVCVRPDFPKSFYHCGAYYTWEKDFYKTVNAMLSPYDDSLIKGRVSKQIRNKTREYMEVFNMGLYDAFNWACREHARKGTKLYLAWYHSDFREYIPSVYVPANLDFNKYPLGYTYKKRGKKA